MLVLSYRTKDAYTEILTTDTDSIINNNSCNIALDNLPDISRLECCDNYFYPDARLNRAINMVVGSSPVYYLDACSGYCANGAIDRNLERCSIDPDNESFLRCVNTIKPRNCNGLALPIGRVGKRYYYYVNASRDLCSRIRTCPTALTL